MQMYLYLTFYALFIADICFHEYCFVFSVFLIKFFRYFISQFRVNVSNNNTLSRGFVRFILVILVYNKDVNFALPLFHSAKVLPHNFHQFQTRLQLRELLSLTNPWLKINVQCDFIYIIRVIISALSTK